MQIGNTYPVTSPKSVAEFHHTKSQATATPKRSRTKASAPVPNRSHLSQPMSGQQAQKHLPVKRSSNQLDDTHSTPAPVATTTAETGNSTDAPSNGTRPKTKKRRNWAPIAVVPMKDIKIPTDVEPEEQLQLKLQYQDMAIMEQQIFGISTLLSLVKNVLKGSADLKRIAALGRRLSKTRKRFLNCQRGVFDVQNERNPAPAGQSTNNVSHNPAIPESNDASSRPSQASNRSDTDTSMQTAAMQGSAPEKNTSASAPVLNDTVGSLPASENSLDENPTFPQFSLGASGADQPQGFQPEYEHQQHAQPQQIKPSQFTQDEHQKQENQPEHPQEQQIVPSQPITQTTTPLDIAQHPEIQGMWQQQFPIDNSSHMENSALSMALAHNQSQNPIGQNCLQSINKNVFDKGQVDPKKLDSMNGRPINAQEHYIDPQRVAFEANQHAQHQQQEQQTLDAFASATGVQVHPSSSSGLDEFQQQVAVANKYVPGLSNDGVAGGGGGSSLLPNNTREGNGLFPMQMNAPDMGQHSHNHSFFPHGMQRQPQQQQPNVTPSPNVQPPTPLDIQQQTFQAMFQQQHQQQFGIDASTPMHSNAALSVAFGQAPNLVADPNWLQQDSNYAPQTPVQPLQVAMAMPAMKPNIASPVEFFAAHYGGGSDFGSAIDSATAPGHMGSGSGQHALPPPAQQPFEQPVSKLAVDCVPPDAAETNFSPVTTSGHLY